MVVSLTFTVSRLKMLYKLVRRFVILFLLGMIVINHMDNFATFRVCSVLGRYVLLC